MLILIDMQKHILFFLVLLLCIVFLSAEMDIEHREILLSLAKDVKQMKFDIQDLTDDNAAILSILSPSTTTESQ